MGASSLYRILFVVYALLVAYASLYPFEGWRDPGASAFAFLAGGWPRTLLRFDVVVNVLGYAPFGFLGVAALQPRLRGGAALAAVTVGAFLFSLSLEALQSYLPTRTASNLDLLCNVCGAAFGADVSWYIRTRSKPSTDGRYVQISLTAARLASHSRRAES